jgi:hypothetical protein
MTHNILLTRICDVLLTHAKILLLCQPSLNILFSCPAFSISSRPSWSYTKAVQLSMYLQISSRTWSGCLRSLIASRDLCFISILFTPNVWLTTSMSLCLMPYQFTLPWFQTTFLFLFLWVFFFVTQRQIPAPASWCTVAPGSRIGSFLIFYSLGKFWMLTVDWHHSSMHSASIWGTPDFNLG